MRLLTRLRESQHSSLPRCLPSRMSKRNPIVLCLINTHQLLGEKSIVHSSRRQRFHQQQNQRLREYLEFLEDPEQIYSGAMAAPLWVKPILRDKSWEWAQRRKSRSNRWSVWKEDAIMRTNQDDWNITNTFSFPTNNNLFRSICLYNI